MTKDIKYLCVGCFSPWKRQRDIAYLGKDLYCIGNLEPDGQEDYRAVVDAGATVEVGYFPAEHIRDLYRRTQNVLIPAIHGSERTCLEAMSMGIVPEVNPNQNNGRDYGASENLEVYRSEVNVSKLQDVEPEPHHLSDDREYDEEND